MSKNTTPITYTYDEAYTASLLYFNGDEIAANIFVSKYALRNENNDLIEKTPTDMHWRIAKEFARIEKNKFKKPLTAEEIFGYLDGFKKIVPQGSPMSGIGNSYQYVSLSNCYVVSSPLDSYGDILRADQELVQISKRRGGVGLDLSNIRPANVLTKNAARTSTGIIPFAQRYSNSIREVGQQGRRGALMLTLSVHHPQILDFIQCKMDSTKVTGANISVRLTDEFLQAVADNKDYEQRWPIDALEPRTKQLVSAKLVWDTIVKCAHANAEPGLMFWDNILKESPADCYEKFGFRTVCSNPCSELSMCADDSCRLLLLNLYTYVLNPFTNQARFDYEAFYAAAQVAQRLMDDMVDLELECIDRIIGKIDSDPEPENIKQVEKGFWTKAKSKCKKGRRTGTGITALGDTLAALGIGYGTAKSIDTTDQIYKTLKLGCLRSSVDMAKELGPFPIWDSKLEESNPFLLRIKDEDIKLYEDMQKYGRRNIALLTTAPTGSVSILTQTSGGIEPQFMISYERNKKVNPGDPDSRVDFVDKTGDSYQKFKVVVPKLTEWMKITGETDETKSPWHGFCAEDIDWIQRVKLQAVAQRHIDHSISATINLPENVSVETVAKIYETAWLSGCKGITVYRKGCRTGILVDAEQNKKDTVPGEFVKRPKTLPCDTHHITVKGQEYFVLVGLNNNKPYEVFAGKNGLVAKSTKKGSITKIKRGHYFAEFDDGSSVENINDFIQDEEAAITRLLSLSLRHGADIHYAVTVLERVPGDMQNFGRCIARALKKYIKDGDKVSGVACPSCGSDNLVRQEGCSVCKSCGMSSCS